MRMRLLEEEEEGKKEKRTSVNITVDAVLEYRVFSSLNRFVSKVFRSFEDFGIFAILRIN